MKKQKSKCLVPKCNLPAEARGICKPHYQSAYALVHSGRTSWDKLVAMGKCLEKTANKTGARKKWFEAAVESACSLDTQGVP